MADEAPGRKRPRTQERELRMHPEDHREPNVMLNKKVSFSNLPFQ